VSPAARTARWHASIVVLALLALPLTAIAAPEKCAESPSEFNGYRVQSVQLIDPLGFIAPWTSPFARLERTLAIRTGQPFSIDGLNSDVIFLRRTLEASGADSTQLFKLAYVRECVFDRDPDARTLRVSYTLFTNVVSAIVAPSIEESANESDRPATTGAARAVSSQLSIVPLLGYNATRRTFGGAAFSTTTPGLHVDGETRASGNSLTGHVEAGGTIVAPSTRWQGGEFTGAFEYLDTPAGSVHAHEGKVAARFSQSTKPLTSQRVVFRYGGTIEGGRQTSDSATALEPDTGYGSVKLYAGVTGRRGHSAFTSSYGFQVGSTFTDGVPSFRKHLFDAGFMTRFTGTAVADGIEPFSPVPAGVHRSLDLQTRFTAGVLENPTAAPVAERFLGGNQVRPFVSDDSWVVQSDAFIRSIPENTLATAPGFSGGDRFFSANVTAAWPLWGRPLLPGELAGDPQFVRNLNGGFNTIVDTLADNYRAKDPEYRRRSAAIPTHARVIRTALDAASAALQHIPPDKAKQQPLAKALKDVLNDIRKTKSSITLIDGGDLSVSPGLVNFYLPSLDSHADVLQRQLAAVELGSVGSEILASLTETAAPRDAIKGLLMEIDSSAYRQQAAATLAPAHRVLDVFLHELNLYSIAPVAIFDAARISPSDGGTRYGVGGGLRFSLVSVNVSASYVFNIHPVAAQGAGAFFFQFDVTNVLP
jgi:hypothetical protein